MTMTLDGDAGLAELARRNQELLSRIGANGAPNSDLEAFVADVTEAGARYAPGPARDSLRNMLYFWTSELAARGGSSESSLPKLAAFREASAPQTPPSGGEDEKAARTRQVLQIAALARLWKTAPDNQRCGYLLTHDALETAREFADEDPDIHELVRASDDYKKNSNLRSWIVVLGVALSVSFCLFIWYGRLMNQAVQDVMESQAIFTSEKQKFYAHIDKMVDALSQDNVDPLRNFLETYGRANPALMSRLSLAPAAAASLNASSSVPAGAKFDVNLQNQINGIGECKGYVWLGSDLDPRIAGGQKPSDFQPGQTITVDKRDWLALRSGVPDDKTFALKPQIGTVPAGATVTIDGDVKKHARTMKDDSVVDQFWAPVSVPSIFCANVFVQYFGDSAKLNPLLAAIDATGAQTPPQERLSSAQGLSEIRYFFPGDRKLAELIVNRLKPPVQARTIAIKDLTGFPTKPKPGTLELWIDLTGS